MNFHSVLFTAALVLFLAAIAAGCQKQEGVEAVNESNNPSSAAPPLDRLEKGFPISGRDFLIAAEKAEVMEQSLSQAAWDRAESAEVKEYARSVIDNHAKSLQQLRDLMDRKGVSQPPSVPEARIEGEYRLDSLSGAAFDHEYISLMTAETQQAAARFKQAEETSGDPEVRAYAHAVLPVLEREHEKGWALERKLAKQPGQ